MTDTSQPISDAVFAMKGRVALVTGGARGIGAAVTRRFVASGGRVAATDLRSEVNDRAFAAQRGALGDAFLDIVADASDDARMQEACEVTARHFGAPIDTLVITAADVSKLPWDEIDLSAWDHMMAVNLRGAFIAARHAVPQMRKARYGKIITIGSVMAHFGDPRSLHYVTTKEGLVGFTRSLARAEGINGITVNCVVPGAIASERHYEEGGVDDLGRLAELQTVQRRGYPDDIATACQFLASRAGDFIAGQVITVDGGWTNY